MSSAGQIKQSAQRRTVTRENKPGRGDWRNYGIEVLNAKTVGNKKKETEPLPGSQKHKGKMEKRNRKSTEENCSLVESLSCT